MNRVLLVTGARSLATRDGAEAWARGLIREALADCELLIVGDALGPDEWAWREAYCDGCAQIAGVRDKIHTYITGGRLAGVVEIVHEGVEVGHRRWAPPGTSTHPLKRNAAMVADCRRLAAEGHAVTVLALLDGLKADAPGKRATRGTEHTAGLAERAGLTVRREVWR